MLHAEFSKVANEDMSSYSGVPTELCHKEKLDVG
jgi:hypothetical protein